MEGPLPTVRPEEIAVVVAFNNAESHYLPRSAHNKEEYAKFHGYHYIEDGIYDTSRLPAWGKILTLLKYMKSYPEIKWFWWIDIDTVILDPFVKLEEHILGNLTQPKYADKDFVISWDCNGMNAGSFMIRNSPWSVDFLQRVYAPEFAHRFGYAEQGVFQYLYQTDEEVANHFYFVNQRKFNAFPPEACGEMDTVHTYREGDFLIHLAGCWVKSRNNCKERFNEFWNRRIPAPVRNGAQLTQTVHEPFPTFDASHSD
ncbi:galactosyl transferase [Basidiobolus meristosporus CBS 931.73]|uniref:Galactosyl transferase n=1 Tax=Basidiobolus meristosporus CBS 931.73 TaxID=1314790 RepID=A0A1Y1YTF1_9FUNG|nr:galactosyl transferase [Basidiobolus meristosporus CBS 931.73]|eukprot:ORY01017.1 galactosyl transferase [Basidiobolus meristosporus CBS 931.73]